MLFHLKAGDGKALPLVLLHGFLGSHKDFLEVVKHLNRPCILIDLFGHGNSPPPPDTISFFEMARSIAKILLEMKYPIFDLAGYSMGGRIALYLHKYYPDLFHRVILMSAHTGLSTIKSRKNHRKWHKEWMDHFQNLTATEFVEKWYSQPLFTPLKTSGNLPKRELTDLKDLQLIFNNLSLLKQEKHIPKDLKLISGELDLKYQTLYHCLQKEHISIKGAGHAVHIEHPAATALAIETHLTRRA